MNVYDFISLKFLIVNPSFTGYFDVRKFKETPQNAGVKCIALMCSVADQGVLRNYDESLTIYDDADTIREKLNRLLNVPWGRDRRRISRTGSVE